MLRELQNIDNYRFLVRSSVDIDTVNLSVVPGTTADFVPGSAFLEGNCIQNDQEVGKFIVNSPDPDLDLNVEPAFSIVLDGGPGEGRRLPTTLILILAQVRAIVAAAHELPECRTTEPPTHR